MLNGIRPNLNRLLFTATSAVTFALGARFGYGLDVLPSAAIAVGGAITGYTGARVYSLFNDVEKLIQRLNTNTMNDLEDSLNANRQFMIAVQNRVDDLAPLMRSLNLFIARLSINANLVQNDITRQIRRIIRQNANIGQDINTVLGAARDFLLNAMEENPELSESIMQATTTLNRILDTIQNVMVINGMRIPAAEEPAEEPQVELPAELQELLARLAEVGQRADEALNENQEQDEQAEAAALPFLVAAQARPQAPAADEPRRSVRLANQRHRI